MKQLKNGNLREIINSFSGMNALLDPTKLTESELALLENYTLKSYGNVGSLVSRNGFTRYGDTQIASGGTGVGSMFEATINGSDYIISNIINGSSSALYYKIAPYTTGAWTAITGSSGSDRAYKLNYASFKDRVYIANNGGGASSNTVWDGTTAGFYDMGCPPPSSKVITATASNSNGRLSSSSGYYYYVTFLYDGSQESPIMGYTFTSTGASDDTITLTNIPITPLDGTANARITARKIYRLKVTTGIAYYVDTITNNTDTTYIDYKADNELLTAIDLDVWHTFNIPYYSKYICMHKERSILGKIYSPNIFTAPTGANITLTGSDTGGSLGSGVYKYRFYFANEIYDGGDNYKFYLTPYVEKTIDMNALGFTGADNSVTINFSALSVRNWFDTIYIERTSSGGSDFIRISAVTFSLGSYIDTTADSLRGVTTVGFILSKVEDTTLDFPGVITVSDAGKPDLFSTVETAQDGTLTPSANTWNIGEPITGIHSEENRIVIFSANNIYQLDTTTTSRNFWRLDKIVSGIGSDDGLQVQCGNKYLFVKTSNVTKNKLTIYEWDGRSEPVPCELAIRDYIADLNATGTITVNDIKFYSLDNAVYLFTQYTDDLSTSRTVLFIYNIDMRDSLGLGKWDIWLNATNLNFKTGFSTKSYGMLIGSGDGYIHYQYNDGTNYRDVIGGSNTNFTTKLRTKTWEMEGDIRPRLLRPGISSTGAVTPLLKTAVEGVINAGDNMPAAINGYKRLKQEIFTGATDRGYKQVYFQIEITDNQQYKIHNMTIDFEQLHPESGGR